MAKHKYNFSLLEVAGINFICDRCDNCLLHSYRYCLELKTDTLDRKVYGCEKLKKYRDETDA